MAVQGQAMGDLQVIYRKAQKLEAEGEFLQACLMYEEMLELNPKLAQARVSQAVCFAKAEEFEMALEALDAALRANDALFSAHFNKGIVLHQMHDYEGALESFENALKLRPERFVYEEVADAANLAQQYERALDAAAKGLSISEEFSHALHLSRVVAFIRLSRHEDAFEDAEAILRQVGWEELKQVELQTYAMVFKRKAIALLDVGETEEALRLLEDVNMALDNPDASALCAQAYCLIVLQRVKEAIKLLQSAKEVDPTNWRIKVAEAKACIHQAEYAPAVKLLEDALGVEECSDNTAIRFLYAECLFHLDRLAEAHENYEFVHQHDSANWVASDRLGYLLLHFEQFEEAVHVLRHVISTAKQKASDATHYNLGYALLMQNDADIAAAVESFKMAHRINPDNENALLALQQTQRLLKETKENRDDLEVTKGAASHRRDSEFTEGSVEPKHSTAFRQPRRRSTTATRVTRVSDPRLTRLQTRLHPSAPSPVYGVIPIGNTAKLLGRFNS